MLQIAYIREHKAQVIAALAKRNIDASQVVNEVVLLDENRRAAQAELDAVLTEANKLSAAIGEMMKSGEREKAAILKETVLLKEQSKELSEKNRAIGNCLTAKIIYPSQFACRYCARRNFCRR